MRDLSVIIPARNEMFLQATIENILENREADTEIIAVLDGYWPEPPVCDDDRVTIIHVTEPIGQRAATNMGVRASRAKYIMKIDAHCAVDKGFDIKLMQDCQPDWTMVPMLYNLHAFDWKCKGCGNRTYQGTLPQICAKCKATQFEMVMVWKPRPGKGPYVAWRFDSQMMFRQWRKYHKRPEAQGRLVETMSFAGPCFFMERKRYKRLGGCDERHGSWGQFGTEWACKSWLSGGKLITTRKTWFAHMFRTGNFKGAFGGGSSFPYPISGHAQEKAQKYSRNLWLNDKWPKAVHPLSWLVDKFKPVPGWHEGAK